LSPELEKIRNEMARATRDFAEEHWLRAPEGKWNSAQILEHLLLSYTGTTKGLMRAMESGQPLARKPTVPDRVRAFVLARVGFIVPGGTSPKQTTPRGVLPPGSVQKFNDGLVAMDACLCDAEKRFGKKTKLLDHPFIGPLDAQQWRRFHRVHSMHHLQQIKRRGRVAPG
jgi:hypothetical protein